MRAGGHGPRRLWPAPEAGRAHVRHPNLIGRSPWRKRWHARTASRFCLPLNVVMLGLISFTCNIAWRLRMPAPVSYVSLLFRTRIVPVTHSNSSDSSARRVAACLTNSPVPDARCRLPPKILDPLLRNLWSLYRLSLARRATPDRRPSERVAAGSRNGPLHNQRRLRHA